MNVKEERVVFCKKLKTLLEAAPDEIWPIDTAVGYCMGQMIAEGTSIQQVRELIEKVLMRLSS